MISADPSNPKAWTPVALARYAARGVEIRRADVEDEASRGLAIDNA